MSRAPVALEKKETAMKRAGKTRRQLSITLKTALLSWLVTILTLLTFAMLIIPEQKRAFLESLSSKAHGVAVSLRDVTAGSVIDEDFSTVVDHCMQLVQGDTSLDYLVITRNDGFSLIHERTGWREEESLPIYWHPEKRLPRGRIEVTPFIERRVYHYAQPFDYSAIEWGWIHVGLSLEGYDRSVAAVYWRTSILAIVFVAISLLASVVYARQLVKPILSLQNVVRRVADGNLSARALVQGGDELASLAASVNTMADALLQRDKIMETVRFSAQQFLSTMDWRKVIEDVLKMIGEAARASRAYVFENHMGGAESLLCSQRYEWASTGIERQIDNPCLQSVPWYGIGFESWADRLKKGEMVSYRVRELSKMERDLLEPQGIKCLILSPVWVENSWWGILGLDDCVREREWTDAERDSLRAIADMLGAAIGKQQIRESLLRAKEAAEAASQAKSQFLANMSHEIRTPMNGVLGMIDLLMRTQLTSQQLDYSQTARASGEALLTVINDVLDLSKIEAGKLKLEQIDFNPHQTVQEVMDLLAGRAQEKALKLTFSVAPDVPRAVRGDPGRLRQVLLNMVSNAIKFTEHGQVAIRVDLASKARAVVSLRFEVQDTGIGISADTQAAIFEPFVQADGTTTRKYGGTGLGLTVSRQLVEMMGGEVGVASAVGEGSTFWFTVAVPKGAEPGKEAVSTEKASEKAEFRARVLVAEDNPINQQVVEGMLEILGCEADLAASGHEALAAWGNRRYDLVLMDCQMPEMDGYEATRIIRQREAASGSASRTVIIALTANVMEGDRERCLAAGMNDYLGKPFKVEQLRRVLERWLRKESNSEQPTMDESGGGLPSATASEAREPTNSPYALRLEAHDCLDRVALSDIKTLQINGEVDLLTRVIHTYLDKTPGLLEHLQAATEAEDSLSVQETAHSLKSSSAFIGALRLASHCAEIEAMAKAKDLDTIKLRLPELLLAFDKVRNALLAEY